MHNTGIQGDHLHKALIVASALASSPCKMTTETACASASLAAHGFSRQLPLLQRFKQGFDSGLYLWFQAANQLPILIFQSLLHVLEKLVQMCHCKMVCGHCSLLLFSDLQPGAKLGVLIFNHITP